VLVFTICRTLLSANRQSQRETGAKKGGKCRKKWLISLAAMGFCCCCRGVFPSPYITLNAELAASTEFP